MNSSLHLPGPAIYPQHPLYYENGTYVYVSSCCEDGDTHYGLFVSLVELPESALGCPTPSPTPKPLPGPTAGDEEGVSAGAGAGKVQITRITGNGNIGNSDPVEKKMLVVGLGIGIKDRKDVTFSLTSGNHFDGKTYRIRTFEFDVTLFSGKQISGAVKIAHVITGASNPGVIRLENVEASAKYKDRSGTVETGRLIRATIQGSSEQVFVINQV